MLFEHINIKLWLYSDVLTLKDTYLTHQDNSQQDQRTRFDRISHDERGTRAVLSTSEQCVRYCSQQETFVLDLAQSTVCRTPIYPLMCLRNSAKPIP